jgi:hypothetical protein
LFAVCSQQLLEGFREDIFKFLSAEEWRMDEVETGVPCAPPSLGSAPGHMAMNTPKGFVLGSQGPGGSCLSNDSRISSALDFSKYPEKAKVTECACVGMKPKRKIQAIKAIPPWLCVALAWVSRSLM